MEEIQLYRRMPSGKAMRFAGAPAREAHAEVRELMKKYEIDSYFEFDESEQIIKGSELETMILLNQVLMRKGQRTLTYDEAMQLGNNFLPRGLYADWGIVVYEKPGENEEQGKILRPEIKRRNWQYPILVHSSSLDLKGKRNIHLGEDTSLIVHGEQAFQELERFDYSGDSGVLRLDRGRYGDSDAGWLGLFYSDEHGRVPWICAFGTTQKTFEGEIVSKIEEEHASKVRKLEERKERAIKIGLEAYRKA